jgi:hypothetical protein
MMMVESRDAIRRRTEREVQSKIKLDHDLSGMSGVIQLSSSE